jgi:hypothetical protein
VDFGTLHINGVLQQRGMVGDLSCTAVVEEGGSQRLMPCVGPDAPRFGVVARWYYPSKAPLISVLGAPVYWVLTKVQGPVSELSQVLWSRLFVTIIPRLSKTCNHVWCCSGRRFVLRELCRSGLTLAPVGPGSR